MTQVRRVTGLGVGLALALAVPTVTLGRQASPPQDVGGPFTGPVVRNAPFSAEATTTVRETLHDGTRIDQTSTARYYRDSAGRVRVEQTVINFEGLNPGADKQVRITIAPKPGGDAYTLDTITQTIARNMGLADVTVGGGKTFALPLGIPTVLIFSRPGSPRDHLVHRGTIDIQEESLGDRQIAGVDTIGWRRTGIVPSNQIGNDRPIEILDERWESPELKLVIYSRSSDSRTGVIEYRLSNITRTEPEPGLFVVPENYTFALSRDTGCIDLVYADNFLDPKRPLRDQLRDAKSPSPIVRTAAATFSCR
jgi:hypothetical protein